MRRFYLPPSGREGRRLIFPPPTARHIVRVLRLKKGERIEVFDGRGREYEAVLDVLSPRHLEAAITAERAAAPARSYSLDLAQGLLKGADLSRVIRQCVEVGISSFYPLITERCVTRTTRRGERWTRIAAEAARQSGQSLVPAINLPLNWPEFLSLVSAYDLCLLAWEAEEEQNLKSVLTDFSPGESPARVLIAIGPEGGFTRDEVNQARAAGFRAVTLGPTTLRASTAGVAALSAIHYHFIK